MNKSELPELSQRLAQLADALGGRAPSPAGLMVWGDALQECRTDDVKIALSDWPKKNVKMPSPADILKVCRSETSRRLEDEAEQNRRAAPTLKGALRSAADGPTETGRAALREILSILKSPKPDPKDWARVLKVREESGETLDSHQSRMWREALREAV